LAKPGYYRNESQREGEKASLAERMRSLREEKKGRETVSGGPGWSGWLIIILLILAFAGLAWVYSTQSRPAAGVSPTPGGAGGAIATAATPLPPVVSGLEGCSRAFSSEFSVDNATLSLKDSVSFPQGGLREDFNFTNRGAGDVQAQLLLVVPEDVAKKAGDLALEGAAEWTVLSDSVASVLVNVPAGGSASFHASAAGVSECRKMLAIKLSAAFSETGLGRVASALSGVSALNLSQDGTVETGRALEEILNSDGDMDSKVSLLNDEVARLAETLNPQPAAGKDIVIEAVFEDAPETVDAETDFLLAPAPVANFTLNSAEIVSGGVRRLTVAKNESFSQLRGPLLAKPGQGDLWEFADLAVNESRDSYQFTVTVDLSSLGENVADRDLLSGNVTFSFAREGGRERTIQLLFYLTHVDPAQFLVLSPTKMDLFEVNGKVASKPVFLANNFPFQATVSGCGLDGTPKNGEVRAALVGGGCAVKWKGREIGAVSTTVTQSELEIQSPEAVGGQPEAFDPLACSGRFCDCGQLQEVLYSLVDKYNADSAAIKNAFDANEVRNGAFSESFVVGSAVDSSACELPAPFTGLQLAAGAYNIIRVKSKVTDYPYVRAETTADRGFSCSDAALCGALKSKEWYYVTVEKPGLFTGAELGLEALP